MLHVFICVCIYMHRGIHAYGYEGYTYIPPCTSYVGDMRTCTSTGIWVWGYIPSTYIWVRRYTSNGYIFVRHIFREIYISDGCIFQQVYGYGVYTFDGSLCVTLVSNKLTKYHLLVFGKAFSQQIYLVKYVFC